MQSVIAVTFEYVGTVPIDGLCPRCVLPSLVASVGVISCFGMLSVRIVHCTDCGWESK